MSSALSTSMATPTVPLFVPGISPLPATIAANIYTQDASINYYTLNCAGTATGSACPFSSGFVLAQGPSTARWTLAPEAGRSTSVGCALSGTTAAQCTGLTVASGSTVTTTYSTQPTFVNVALTSVGNGIKVPAATPAAGSGTAGTTGTAAAGGSNSAAGGAARTTSSKAAAPLATGMVGLTGAMAAIAVVVGAL